MLGTMRAGTGLRTGSVFYAFASPMRSKHPIAAGDIKARASAGSPRHRPSCERWPGLPSRSVPGVVVVYPRAAYAGAFPEPRPTSLAAENAPKSVRYVTSGNFRTGVNDNLPFSCELRGSYPRGAARLPIIQGGCCLWASLHGYLAIDPGPANASGQSTPPGRTGSSPAGILDPEIWTTQKSKDLLEHPSGGIPTFFNRLCLITCHATQGPGLAGSSVPGGVTVSQSPHIPLPRGCAVARVGSDHIRARTAPDRPRTVPGCPAGDPSSDFRLDGRSGALSTARPLDRERTPRYSLTVVARDGGRPALSATATVEVAVLDVNDHAPRFQSAGYTADVSEDVPLGSFVLEVKASDRDQGANGQVAYFLSGGAQGVFIVDQSSGRIITAAPLDRERTAAYSFHVHAADSSPSNPLNASAHVTVYVQDVNDNAPFFVQDPLVLNVSAVAVAANGHRVLATMRAEDKDFGANGSVFYRFASPVRGFSINSLTGDIQATERLQGLTQGQRTLIVEAVDQGSPSQASLGVVVVYVREQSYRGVRFPRNARDVSVQENAAKGRWSRDFAEPQNPAQYPDGSRLGITYSLFSGNQKHSFGINPSSGEHQDVCQKKR
ncbi:hypothetical protein CRUP_011250 [Coryphaenoides rupestris]|nr:hypothetical protein CRUP_011250 [Coryphaenoides rupestris]